MFSSLSSVFGLRTGKEKGNKPTNNNEIQYNFFYFPLDVICNCLKSLSIYDLNSLLRVCKRSKDMLLNNENVWMERLQCDFEVSYSMYIEKTKSKNKPTKEGADLNDDTRWSTFRVREPSLHVFFTVEHNEESWKQRYIREFSLEQKKKDFRFNVLNSHHAASEKNVDKWVHLIGSDPFRIPPLVLDKKIVSLLYEGVPDKIRGRLWLSLARGRGARIFTTEEYLWSLKQSCECADQISRDLSRSAYTDPFFKDIEETHQQIYDITHSFSILNKKIEFCCGITFYYQFILLYAPFHHSISLINAVFSLPGMKNGIHGFIQPCSRALNLLIPHFVPEVHKAFESAGLEGITFLGMPICLGFITYLPHHLVVTIWDLFLGAGLGLPCLLASILVLLDFNKRKFRNKSFEILADLLKRGEESALWSADLSSALFFSQLKRVLSFSLFVKTIQQIPELTAT